MITGERLTEAEKNMKLLGACVDLFTFGQGMLAMKGAGLAGKQLCKALGKEMVVDFFANTAAYTMNYGCGELGVPTEITWLLSVATGCTVATAGNKFLFKDLSGNVTEYTLEEVQEKLTKELPDGNLVKGVSDDNLTVPTKTLVEADSVLAIGNQVSESGSAIDIGYMKNNADPMRNVLGSGRVSNPEEWTSIIQNLEKSGVEITYREGSMAYAPGLTDGSPGQLVIDPDASLSALKHEYQHFLDAQAENFPSFGKQMFEEPKTRVIKELRAYMVEIKEADMLGLKEVSEQLFENYRQEREWIINQYIIPGGE